MPTGTLTLNSSVPNELYYIENGTRIVDEVVLEFDLPHAIIELLQTLMPLQIP
jgi:hypothetical protein